MPTDAVPTDAVPVDAEIVRRTGLTAADIDAVRWLGEVRHRPLRRQVSVVETRLDADSGRLRGQLLVVELDGAGEQAEPRVDVRAGEWSPTGEAVAVLDRSGVVWLWSPEAGPAEPLAGPRAIGRPSWSPDGQALVVPGADGLWRLDLRTRGWDRLAALAAREVRWSPDGPRIAALLDDADGGSRLAVLDPRHGAVEVVVTRRGRLTAPAWRPDGSAIALLGADPADAARNHALLVVDPRRGEVHDRAADRDLSIGSCVQSDDLRGYGDARLVWTADGTGIVSSLADGGRGQLVRVPVGGAGELAVLSGGDRAVLAFDLDAADGIAAVISDPATPGELHRLAADGSGERRLTGRNDAWLAGRDLAPVEPVAVPRADGTTIDTWLYRPRRATSAPVLLAIHGGPHWPAGWRFCFDYQRLAALGFAVVVANPTGSGGYGERYARAVQGDWGGPDRADLLRVVEHLSARPDLDAARWAATGVSYGGYLAALLATGAPRIRAVIAENGITDLARYATWAARTPAGRRYADVELGDPGRYRSPLAGADRVAVPVLLVHAEHDTDCPIEQSELFHAALSARGRPVELVRIPDEGHLMVLEGTRASRRLRWSAVDRFLAEHVPGAESREESA